MILSLEENIAHLGRRRKQLAEEISVLDVQLNTLLAQGKDLSSQIEEKRERCQHLEHAISNIRAVIELEISPVPEVASDPWGES